MTLVNAQDRFTERMRLHTTGTGQPLTELSIPELWPVRTRSLSRAG
ncbi:hypothetical protein [Streptomyces sp. NPDC056663]